MLAVVEGEVGFAEDAFRVNGDAIVCHEEMRRCFIIIIIFRAAFYGLRSFLRALWYLKLCQCCGLWVAVTPYKRTGEYGLYVRGQSRNFCHLKLIKV